MIVFTQDPNIIRGASRILDLNSKPVPKLIVAESKPGDNRPVDNKPAEGKPNV
jgi:hypothetical protein